MQTREQQPQQGGAARCPICRGTGQVKQTSKDGKVRDVRCFRCRGTGQAGGYQTK